ncbi:hypothetical protein EKH55_3357 [Sinorhizobium alkalisoli]|nr:hypothetical protein EKH55_3357 [Sinorhizobium alkalisoli]
MGSIPQASSSNALAASRHSMEKRADILFVEEGEPWTA